MRVALEDNDAGSRVAVRHYTKTIPAPVSGLASDMSIAKENPGAAEVLDNFIPTTRGIRARGGSQRYATASLLAVETLIAYYGAASKAMFAVSGGNIYDVTSPVSATIIPAPVLTGLLDSELSYINFSNAGGDFLLAFNGVDTHKVYNGATWASNTPAITGVSSADITFAWVHANRVWMVQKNSKKSWYLPVDSVGGAALDFTLDGVFKNGGKLIGGSTWSRDSGTGSADRCVFFSDQGEVAVYDGDYPGGTWSVFGVYTLAKPLGKFSSERVISDLLIMTVNGIVSLAEAVTKDPSALVATSVTRMIEPDWKKATALYGDKTWHFLKWDQANLGIVAIPADTTTVAGTSLWGEFIWGVYPWGADWTIEVPIETPICFVVNLQTGRWCRITGWDCRSMIVFNGDFYFGTSNGAIVRGDVGGNDLGKPYECRAALWPSRFDYVGEKQFLQAAAVFEHSTSFNARTSISTNNTISWPAISPPAQNDNTSGTWDEGEWDDAVWDAESEKTVRYEKWSSLVGRGRVGALLLQMTFNNTTTPNVEFTEAIITYERGPVVT
jgi:hypothetical protein